VSAKNPFALIANVGEDCAGAVQFVREERLDAVLGGGPMQVEWLDDEQVAERLRMLREDRGAWRSPSDTGQFSLSGAQAKTAFLLHDGRFGTPTGRTPTTHILKPPLREFPGHVENEHLCMTLARELGLATAVSEVRRFQHELAIVVTRYDRARTADLAASAAARAAAANAAGAEGDVDASSAAAEAAAATAEASALGELAESRPILRLHQEDMCQALGVSPTSKYQNEGGPSPAQIAGLLRDHSSSSAEDIPPFVAALAFNWSIAGTQAHAKNYSLLLAAGGRVRLAPLYDLASALPYPGLELQRIRLAMKIGSTYRIRDIRGRHWRGLCQSLRIDEDETIDRIERMAGNISDQVGDLGGRMTSDGLDAEAVGRLVKRIGGRARTCRKLLASGA
jgi:serine/threonine-protein kinase HipA